MATNIYAMPVVPGADVERINNAIADLRSSINTLETYASEAPRVTRRHTSRILTISAMARELAATVAADARHTR
jgi:hypothetical protein